MSYRVIRVLLCDCQDCETPSPYVLQGEDDQALDDGWSETVVEGQKLHTCPDCVKKSVSPVRPRELVRDT